MKGKGGGGGAINPVAMGKALIAKANFTPSKNGGNFSGRSGEGLADIFTSKDGAFVPNKHRAFLMDTQVKYTIVSIVAPSEVHPNLNPIRICAIINNHIYFQGLQSQERNLFLFNDLLLIAKERSSSHFKLKDQVSPNYFGKYWLQSIDMKFYFFASTYYPILWLKFCKCHSHL